MHIQLTSNNFELHDHAHDLISSKFQAPLERLLTHFDSSLPVQLHIIRDKNGIHTVTSSLELPSLGHVAGRHSHLDLVVALKHVREELEKQIKRFEGK